VTGQRAARLLRVLRACAVVAALPCAAAAQTAPPRKVEVRRALSPTGMLRLWNLTGRVRVTGWERDSLVVTGTAPAGVGIHCGGSVEGMKCSVGDPSRDDAGAGGAVLDVRVPRGGQLWIKTASADVSISGMRGDLDVYSVTGAIELEGDVRTANLESMGGDIRIRGTARTLRARTAGGEVTLSGRVEDATVSTVRGGIRLLAADLRRGSFTSTDGPILWDGALAHGASLEFSSHSGAIELRLPARTGGEFTIDDFQGRVVSDFATRAVQQARGPDGTRITFVLPPRDGGRVVVRNFKGPVALKRR
jgi:hypothetical protein